MHDSSSDEIVKLLRKQVLKFGECEGHHSFPALVGYMKAKQDLRASLHGTYPDIRVQQGYLHVACIEIASPTQLHLPRWSAFVSSVERILSGSRLNESRPFAFEIFSPSGKEIQHSELEDQHEALWSPHGLSAKACGDAGEVSLCMAAFALAVAGVELCVTNGTVVGKYLITAGCMVLPYESKISEGFQLD